MYNAQTFFTIEILTRRDTDCSLNHKNVTTWQCDLHASYNNVGLHCYIL